MINDLKTNLLDGNGKPTSNLSCTVTRLGVHVSELEVSRRQGRKTGPTHPSETQCLVSRVWVIS